MYDSDFFDEVSWLEATSVVTRLLILLLSRFSRRILGHPQLCIAVWLRPCPSTFLLAVLCLALRTLVAVLLVRLPHLGLQARRAMRVLWLQVSSHEKWSGSVNHVILMLCHSVIGHFHCGSLLIWLDVTFGSVLVTEASLKKKIKCSHAVEASSGGESFDPSAIDLGAVQKSIQEENKFIFSATCSKIVEDGTSRRVCVIFQLLTPGGRGRSNVYWCFKPAYFRQNSHSASAENRGQIPSKNSSWI